METNARYKAQEVMAKLKPETQAAHQAAWKRCEAFILGRVAKGAKVFEVHHALEHARKAYLSSLAQYFPPDMCERAVHDLYPGV